MSEPGATIIFAELSIRAAAAGVLVLLGVLHAARGRGFGVQRIAALFEFGTAAYVIVSAPRAWDSLGPAGPFLAFVAGFNSIFFWWLATALFDDGFRWRLWRFAPALALLGLLIWRRADGHEALSLLIRQTIVLGMMLHAVWLALRHRREDLVEFRRRFRIVFAVVVGATGALIAAVELTLGATAPPDWLTLIHAFAIAALVFAFACWLIETRDIFAPVQGPGKEAPRPAIDVADQRELERLRALMEEGAYKEEGITVAKLAEKVGVPEHRLRRLVNGVLGHRNFSDFLNSWRIPEAKRLLADPDMARLQVTQIAMDLGYGSVGSFNRAFKAAVGRTPTEHRRAALDR